MTISEMQANVTMAYHACPDDPNDFDVVVTTTQLAFAQIDAYKARVAAQTQMDLAA